MFPKPLMVFDVKNHQKFKKILEKYYLDDVDEKLRKQTNNNLFIFDELKEIKNEIMDCCLSFYRDCCGFDIDKNGFFINSSWFNIVNKNKFLYSHCHRNSHISGVYYINIDNTNPPLIFEKRQEFIQNTIEQSIFSGNPTINTKYNSSSYLFPPKEGQVCIFQSDLYHGHLTNYSDNTRISLAFNSVLSEYDVGDGNAKSYKVKLIKQ